MNNILKDITDSKITYKIGDFKNDSTMVRSLPVKLKDRILSYLKTPPAGMIGDVTLIDPITGECYSHTSVIREMDGFEWSTADIYMFEHYDVKLSDDFLKMFE